MSNFIGSYLSIYLLCENSLSYYHQGSTFLRPYAIIAILLDLVIIGHDMSGRLDRIYIGGHHSNFFKLVDVPIGDVIEGVNVEIW